jgi:hypothetical protein
LAAALLLAAAFLPAACRRKAPGPEECRRFALSVVGAAGSPRLPHAPTLKSEVDELTRACLVTPYDRELLRCVEESGRLRACRSAFALRQAQH